MPESIGLGTVAAEEPPHAASASGVRRSVRAMPDTGRIRLIISGKQVEQDERIVD